MTTPIGDMRREHRLRRVPNQLAEHLDPRLVRDPEVLVTAPVHDRGAVKKAPGVRVCRFHRPLDIVAHQAHQVAALLAG